MNPVKELRDELARIKGEIAKDARRMAKIEETWASRSELQNEIINEQRALLADQKERIDVQEEYINELKKHADLAKALIANLDREAEERNARMADLERRLAKYEEVELSEPIETENRGAETGTAAGEPREPA